MIVLLGEVGNEDENMIADMIKSKKIKKPLVARVAGTAAEKIKSDVQFGHAGAKANAERETASFKNTYLAKQGAYVPKSFDDFGTTISKVYKTLKHKIPSDDTAVLQSKLAIIQSRRATVITSTISDERGEELLYNGKNISDFVKK